MQSPVEIVKNLSESVFSKIDDGEESYLLTMQYSFVELAGMLVG